MRRCGLVCVALVACGPTAPEATSDATEPGASTSGAHIPTTGQTATSSAAMTSGDVSASTGAPAPCGPPCAETWEEPGDLVVGPDADPAELACLVRVGGRLIVQYLEDPAVLAGLASLESVGTLSLYTNPGLERLDELGCLRSVTDLSASHNPNLTSLDALSGVRGVASLALADNPQLAVLPTLATDPEVSPRNLTLTEMDALTDLDALADWGGPGEVTNVALADCASLTSIAGLSGLLAGASEARVQLHRLPALAELDAIAGPAGDLDLELWALPAVVALPAFTAADAYVSLWAMDGLTNVDGLAGIGEITRLELRQMPALADLSGLAGMTSAERVVLAGLPALTDLTGLAGLEQVGELMLGSCDKDVTGGLEQLTSLAGLDSLQTVQMLTLGHDHALVDLAGAPALVGVGGVQIIDMPGLPGDVLAAWLADHGSPPACVDPDNTGMCACNGWF